MSKLKQKDVLKYREGRQSQTTVRRHYLEWRKQQNPPAPYRCDNPECIFYTKRPEWNNKELLLILDHINGVSGDNRPMNLRLLCPNCNSQQSTHGGGNKNRVQQHSGGFALKSKNGKYQYTLPAESGEYEIKSGLETKEK